MSFDSEISEIKYLAKISTSTVFAGNQELKYILTQGVVTWPILQVLIGCFTGLYSPIEPTCVLSVQNFEAHYLHLDSSNLDDLNTKLIEKTVQNIMVHK